MSDDDSPQRDDKRREAQHRDPDAPGAYVDDEEAPDVPEPNEPA